MTSLTEMEEQCLKAFEVVLAFLTQRHVSRPEFVDVVGLVRHMKIVLVNKKYGCPVGKHAGACVCGEPERFL